MTAKKRISIFILALLMMLFLFASCKNNQQGNTPNSDNNLVTTAVPDDQLEDLGTFTVLVQDSGTYANAAANDAVKQHLIEKIANDRMVKIDMNVIPLPANDFINQANAYLTSQAVDGISVDYNASYAQLVSVPGLCAPIDTLLQQFGTTIMTVVGDRFWQDVMQNNQIMGIPSTAIADHTVMIARKDILNMMGIENVNTKDEFLQACVIYDALDKIPLALTWNQISDLLSYTYGIPSGEYDLEDNNVIMREDAFYFYYVYTNPRLTEISYFVNQMRHMYERGYLHPDLFTATEEDMRNKFISGEAMVYAAEYENVYDDYLQLKANDPSAEIMVLSAPTTRRMAVPTLSGEQNVDDVLLFVSSGQNHRALMTFKDWMYSDQTAYMEAMYGVNGTHINFNPYEGTLEYLEGNSADAPAYTGMYTLGIDLDGIFPMPQLLSQDPVIAQKGAIQKSMYDYFKSAWVKFELDIEITDPTAQSKMLTYRTHMDEAIMQYVTGQINDYEFQSKKNSLHDVSMYIRQYIVAMLTSQPQ